jgi:hypothetical protein
MPGPALLLWPGDNHWPGQEINLAEVTNDGSGRIYGALHWDDNGDHAVTNIYSNVLTGVPHEFQVIWEPGQLTYKVDGVQQWVVTQYVPIDHDNGGMNDTIGWLNNNANTSLTVYDVSYVPLGSTASAPVGGTPVATTPPTTTAPTPGTTTSDAPIDWTALAAQAAANYAATGHWYYDLPSTGTATAPAPTTTPTPAPVTATPDPAPAPTPAPTTDATHIDWDALGAQAAANFAATGHWYYDTGATTPAPATATAPAPAPTPVADAAPDWDALAAQATANFNLTGHWFY